MSKKKEQSIEVTYYFSNGESTTVRAGMNGVTQAHIDIVKEMNHEEKKNNDREADHVDMAFERRKYLCQKDPEAYGYDALDIIPDTYTSKETAFVCEEIADAIRQLSPKQQELIMRIFYDRETAYRIAEEEGVSKQAIANRCKKIYKQLRKILENNSSEGVV